LGRIVGILNGAKVPFMIAGSFASDAHGAPRSTNDLDIVVDLTSATLEDLLAALPDDAYHVDAEAARRALRMRSLFNIVDLATAWRIDLIVSRDRPFSRSELERRVATNLLGVPVFIVSAEDTILSELEWSKESGGAETQRRNAAGILASQRGSLDHAYLLRWVDELGLAGEWAQASRAG